MAAFPSLITQPPGSLCARHRPRLNSSALSQQARASGFLRQEAWGRAGLGTAVERGLIWGQVPDSSACGAARCMCGAGGRSWPLGASGPSYGRAARRAAAEGGLAQLEVRRHDLCSDSTAAGGLRTLSRCRWVGCFCRPLDPGSTSSPPPETGARQRGVCFTIRAWSTLRGSTRWTGAGSPFRGCRPPWPVFVPAACDRPIVTAGWPSGRVWRGKITAFRCPAAIAAPGEPLGIAGDCRGETGWRARGWSMPGKLVFRQGSGTPNRRSCRQRRDRRGPARIPGLTGWGHGDGTQATTMKALTCLARHKPMPVTTATSPNQTGRIGPDHCEPTAGSGFESARALPASGATRVLAWRSRRRGGGP